MWKLTVDYLVYYKSLKYSRFNSKCLHLHIKVEDIFTQYWLKQSMFKCLTHLAWNKSGSTGILILPYLSLNRFGPFETFHVINILWFSIKVYHKFCSFNICSLFSEGHNYEDARRSLQYMPHINIRLPKSFIHCPCMTFSMEKIRSSVLYSC